jgi:hypothetical protein
MGMDRGGHRGLLGVGRPSSVPRTADRSADSGNWCWGGAEVSTGFLGCSPVHFLPIFG